jgi:tyrosine-protein kinase Etk/Wzc
MPAQTPLKAKDSEVHTMLDFLMVLADRKGFIVAAALAGGLIMALLSLLVRPMYIATASIMPPQQAQSTATALLGQLGPMAAMAGNTLGIKNPADLYVAILGSRTIADDLVESAGLRQWYGVATLSGARQTLQKRSTFTTGKDPLIKISVEDRDPRKAAALANAYVDELYKQNSRLSLTESGQRRLFFEREMQSQKKALADSEVALKNTQERTGVLQVNSQVDAIIRSMSQVRAEIASREVALSSLKNAATDQNPEVVRQEAEVGALRDQLRNLEASNQSGRPGDALIPTARVPKVGLEYERALRDFQYNQTLFELLSKQYEIARIDEAKEAPIIQVVDAAIPPEHRSWPPRAIFTLLGMLGGGLFAGLIALLNSPLRDPREIYKLHLLKNKLTTFGWTSRRRRTS